jgi:tmRNA-binding protein
VCGGGERGCFVRGKKQHDKRATLAAKTEEREALAMVRARRDHLAR